MEWPSGVLNRNSFLIKYHLKKKTIIILSKSKQISDITSHTRPWRNWVSSKSREFQLTKQKQKQRRYHTQVIKKKNNNNKPFSSFSFSLSWALLNIFTYWMECSTKTKLLELDYYYYWSLRMMKKTNKDEKMQWNKWLFF